VEAQQLQGWFLPLLALAVPVLLFSHSPKKAVAGLVEMQVIQAQQVLLTLQASGVVTGI
jgi:hypothetical protein